MKPGENVFGPRAPLRTGRQAIAREGKEEHAKNIQLKDQEKITRAQERKAALDARRLMHEQERRGAYSLFISIIPTAVKSCDIPNVAFVVQFMVPRTLAIWPQHAGRTARKAELYAKALIHLLIQPSVFQEKNKKWKEGNDLLQQSC